MTELVNLTPHKLNLIGVDGSSLTVEPSGSIARVGSTMVENSIINDIQVYQPKYSDVQGLPEPVDGKIYIVSRMVKDRCPERTDVLVPGNPVRDEAGNIIGSKGLCL